MTEYATYLAQLMAEHGIGQSALGRKTHTHRQQIDKLMKGKTAMSAVWAKRLAPHLEIDWIELLSRHLPNQATPTLEPGVTIGQGIPQPGDPIQDDDEAVLLGFWRRQSLIKKATIFDYLGFDELPTLRSKDTNNRGAA